MTPELFQEKMRQLQESPKKDWNELVHGLLLEVKDRSQLEELGRGVNCAQALIALLAVGRERLEVEKKLSPLLVGMAPNLFGDVLLNAHQEHLNVLKLSAGTEALQHQLSVLVHDMKHRLESLEKTYEEIEGRLGKFEIKDENQNELVATIHEIEGEVTKVQEQLRMSDIAMSLSWMTGRVDIVDTLNSDKVGLRGLLYRGYGSQEKHTGLFGRVNEILLVVYGDPNNPSDKEALRDDEPALEALAKLGIWYLKDYFEIGILPSVQTTKELELDPRTHSELECMQHREKLFEEARNQLKLHDLATVESLKDKGIFSKRALTDYLAQPESPS